MDMTIGRDMDSTNGNMGFVFINVCCIFRTLSLLTDKKKKAISPCLSHYKETYSFRVFHAIMFAGVCQQADKMASLPAKRFCLLFSKVRPWSGFFSLASFLHRPKKEKGNTKGLGIAPELYGDKVRLFLDLGRKVSIINLTWAGKFL